MRSGGGNRLQPAFAGVLLAVLAPAAVALAARVFWGPYQLGPMTVASPLNAQAAVGLCTVLLLVHASQNFRIHTHRAQWDYRMIICALAGAITIYACFHPRPEFYFLSDDFCLLRDAGRYVRDFPIQTGNIFFRPVGYLFVGLIHPWAGLDPYRWHLVGAVLHATCSVLVFLLLHRLGYGLLPVVAGFAEQTEVVPAAEVFLHCVRC